MTRLLAPARDPLRGNLRVPGDKSISHRAALFGLLADGPCRAEGWLDAADTRRSLEAVRTLGGTGELAGGVLELRPPPRGGSVPARGDDPRVIDCGNSGTTARLLLGLLAGWLPGDRPGVVLQGDASLCCRPMARVIDPLRAMGADIVCLDRAGLLPVLVRGAALRGVRHDLAVASAQVKSALLLAGMFATGTTEVHGGGTSRDHTERLLAVMGVGPEAAGAGDGLRIAPGRRPGAFSIGVPGDPSSAAFPLCAAALVPGSRLTVGNHALNPRRLGALQVLRRAGAQVIIEPTLGVPIGAVAGATAGEPAGDVTVAHAPLRAFTITAGEVPALVDEIPVLAVLAARCPGVSLITGAGELRVKESDRLQLLARNLGRLGARIEELPDGLRITGPCRLLGGSADAPLVLETAGDHRIAMAMAVAALTAEGHTALDEPDCVAISYPDFFTDLDGLLSARGQDQDQDRDHDRDRGLDS